MSKDQQPTLTAQLRSALGSIVLLCDKDRSVDWLPIIRNIAAGALANTAGAADEIKRLQAIVDKLPKTADGVPIVPGMVIWPRGDCWIEDEQGAQVELYLRDLATADSIPVGDDPFGKCYSTRKAAEAAGREDAVE